MGQTRCFSSTQLNLTCLLLQSSIKFVEIEFTIPILDKQQESAGYCGKMRWYCNILQPQLASLINHTQQSSRPSSCILTIFALHLRMPKGRWELVQMMTLYKPEMREKCQTRASLVDASRTRDVSIASWIMALAFLIPSE